MYDQRLRVFVSSKMQELAPERSAIKLALDALLVQAWVFEESAGARPTSIQQTYLAEVAAAELFVGLFWKGFGDHTIEEFEHARSLNKDCLVYEKRVDVEQRDPRLSEFLATISDVDNGVASPYWFETIDQLTTQVKKDVASWQVNRVRQTLDQGVHDERERLARQRAQEHGASRQRVVNFAPQGVAELFKDRTSVMADILDALLSTNTGPRVVTVYGQGGIGKTALACEVMRELELNSAVYGLVYLSTRTTGITLERIYRDSARMLGGEIEQKLVNAWKENLTLPAKIQMLLEGYGSQRTVLMLDNLESVLDDQGVLADPDAQQFVNAFLSQNHGARLLITSREPLNPSNEARKYQRPVPLDQGLPAEFAIELLRDLDRDGELGLRDAPEGLLREAVDKTQGFPTALEAIYSILSEERNLTLATLLADEKLFGASVIENLVRSALSRLDTTGHRVMEALAVFGRPVREVAVHYLLSPYVEPTSVQQTLRRLTRGLYVNIKRSTGELILHPFYRDFSYAQIPADGNNNYNRPALESRAASYYAQLRAPRDTWKSIRDLEPQRAEFEHWLRAGEYDRAAEVLSGVDLDYLVWQGYARRVREMRLLLEGKIQARRLQLHHHDSLGQVSMILGPHEEGIEQFKQMREVAIELGDQTAEGKALGSLGETSRLLGRHNDAIAYLQEALALFRRLDDRTEQEHDLFFLGLTYCYAGRPHEALECGDQLMLSAAEQRSTAVAARAHNVLALGNLLLDRWNDTIDHARESIKGYKEVASLDGVCFVGNVEAMALFGGGRHDEGLGAFERTLTCAREDDLPRAEALVLFNQARAFRLLQQSQAALESARSACDLMTKCHFDTGAARSLIGALEAAAKGDRAGEIRGLLDCARESLNNPDLQPPSDLVQDAEARSRELGLEHLAGEADQLARMIRLRQEKPVGRSVSPAAE